jgi:hypothetical protein
MIINYLIQSFFNLAVEKDDSAKSTPNSTDSAGPVEGELLTAKLLNAQNELQKKL